MNSKQEAYLFQAALSELKTGSQVKLRNDSITLRSLTANLQRETDGLEQKMKEDMQRLGSDIQVRHPSSRSWHLALSFSRFGTRLLTFCPSPRLQLEMNARKEETATELQSLDKRVMVSRFFGRVLIRGAGRRKGQRADEGCDARRNRISTASLPSC